MNQEQEDRIKMLYLKNAGNFNASMAQVQAQNSSALTTNLSKSLNKKILDKMKQEEESQQSEE